MKINKGTIIGLAGVAGAGKDLLFKAIKSNPAFGTVEKVSLAQELKTNIAPAIKNYYGVDVFNCSREEKNLVRPMMVAHGTIMRKKTNGKHWTEKASSVIDDLKSKVHDSPTICITDIRYDEYEGDEVQWLTRDLGGYLIHLSKFDYIRKNIITHAPANLDEEKNDPKLRAKSDLEIRWQTASDEASKELMLKKVSKRISEWLVMRAEFNRGAHRKSQINYFSEKHT